MTMAQVDLYLHLASRGEDRRAELIGYHVTRRVLAGLGLLGG
jgi:hypothetical protein